MKKMLSLLVAGTLLLASVTAPLAGDYESAPSSPLSRQIDTTDSTPHRDPPGEMIIADVLFLRPVGFAGMIVGAVGALLAWPFAAATNSCDTVCRALLIRPYEYTFVRPLGQMDWPESADDTSY